MPTIYKLRQFTSDENEVRGAIAALQSCHTTPTVDAIQQFTGLSKSKISTALRNLKSCGLVLASRGQG